MRKQADRRQTGSRGTRKSQGMHWARLGEARALWGCGERCLARLEEGRAGQAGDLVGGLLPEARRQARMEALVRLEMGLGGPDRPEGPGEGAGRGEGAQPLREIKYRGRREGGKEKVEATSCLPWARSCFHKQAAGHQSGSKWQVKETRNAGGEMER